MSTQFWGEHMSVHVDRRQFVFEIGFPSCLQVIAISYTKIHSYILNVRASKIRSPFSHTHTHKFLVISLWFGLNIPLVRPVHTIPSGPLVSGYTHTWAHTHTNKLQSPPPLEPPRSGFWKLWRVAHVSNERKASLGLDRSRILACTQMLTYSLRWE